MFWKPIVSSGKKKFKRTRKLPAEVLPSKRKKRDKRKMFTNVSSSSLKSWGGIELFAYLSVQILYNLLLINFFFNNF